MANARKPLASRVVREEESTPELLDVPAAVLCGHCGQPDCAGSCRDEDTRSGVVPVVPWEQAQGGVWSRLWLSAKRGADQPEAFFATLPDGSLLAALRFAYLAELCAILGYVCLLLPCLPLLAPEWTRALLSDPASRRFVLRALLLGVPQLALLLLFAHTSHGLLLDRFARRAGARSRARRAVRFGLYATGLDLLGSPVGYVIHSAQRGVRFAHGYARTHLRGAQLRAIAAFAERHYHLPHASLQRALRLALWTSSLLTLGGMLALVALALL